MNRIYLFILVISPCWIAAQPIVEVTQHISSNTTWQCDTIYHLTSVIKVNNGANLTIQPGTRIISSPIGGLLITRGAKIFTLGEYAKPILFTHDSSDLAYPKWLGIAILGRAPANCMDPSGNCSVLWGNADPDAYFGGINPEDNSGTLQYVIIEAAGRSDFPASVPGYRGLALAGVGRGTTIEYVQVVESGGTGIELFGGTVNLRHIVCKYNQYDNLAIKDGYAGNIQFLYAVRSADSYYGAKALDSENNEFGNNIGPVSNAAISNATFLMPQQPVTDNLKQAIFLRRQSNSSVYNSAVVGYYPSGIRLSNQGTQTEMRRVFVAGATTAGYDQLATSWFNNTAWDNQFYTNADAVGLENWQSENALLKPNSNLMNAADFTDVPRLSDPFFEKVDFAGAFGIDDWTLGWTTENPENCLFLNQITAETLSAWQIFPNPARDGFIIKNLGARLTAVYKLYDFSGKPVKTGILSSPETRVERNGMPAGFYLLKIDDLDGHIVAYKMILD